jgi:hypothetical protein
MMIRRARTLLQVPHGHGGSLFDTSLQAASCGSSRMAVNKLYGVTRLLQGFRRQLIATQGARREGGPGRNADVHVRVQECTSRSDQPTQKSNSL